jgi:hypothetical protein
MIKAQRTRRPAQLKIVGIRLRRPTAESQPASGVQGWLNLSIEIESLCDVPLFVWSMDQGYSYDASAHVLSVQLAEVPLNLPPGVKLESDHPSVPPQVELAPKDRTNLTVQIPGFTRLVIGASWREEPIAQIDKVHIDLQYGSSRVQPPPIGESAAEFRKRLLEHGAVSQAEIIPTAY